MKNMKNMKNSNWELCPKCDGAGVVIPKNIKNMLPPVPDKSPEEIMEEFKRGTIYSHFEREQDRTCPVCKGRMIINSHTGVPPIINCLKQ